MAATRPIDTTSDTTHVVFPATEQLVTKESVMKKVGKAVAKAVPGLAAIGAFGVAIWRAFRDSGVP
jgi:hypothetical protein